MEYEEGIYPSFSRIDGLYADYARIAMEHYYVAKESLVSVKSEQYECENRIKSYRKLQRNVIISIVFSAMCVESFLNDYAAACLGDKEFYQSFDSLSPEKKFQLICTFILKHKIEKDKKYYCRLKDLIKARNNYIHNKSTMFDFEGIPVRTLEDVEATQDLLYDEEFERNRIREQNIELAQEVQQAKFGIEALIEIARLIDDIDISANALGRIFWPQYINGEYLNDHPIDKVLEEFRIGMD